MKNLNQLNGVPVLMQVREVEKLDAPPAASAKAGGAVIKVSGGVGRGSGASRKSVKAKISGHTAASESMPAIVTWGPPKHSGGRPPVAASQPCVSNSLELLPDDQTQAHLPGEFCRKAHNFWIEPCKQQQLCWMCFYVESIFQLRGW